MLPEKAKYEYLAALPENKDIAEEINNAMSLIEAEYPDLAGNLPKNYQEFENDLLVELIRLFNSDAIKQATGDVFGRIYEYFLMKFSMQGAGAQEGGEFFTPPSLVQLIVNFIEPTQGIIHDPACGSGGMFVQTGYFIKDHTKKGINQAVKCYGTELKSNNTKLAKINLAIHGIEGKIFEANSFYTDPHTLVGKCDYVMANPPFNVNKVDKNKEYVKSDPRLPFGVPSTDNGNYLWMQYFYSYLNTKGKAGFVMASSATDAGHSEKLIRQKLIETQAVDCIVSVGNNFFYTKGLPCHVWFYDKAKTKENKKKILMLDVRNVYRKVSSTINDFSEGQLLNLTTLMKLYRGENNAFKLASEEHKKIQFETLKKIHEAYKVLVKELNATAKELKITLKLKTDIKFSLPTTIKDAEKIAKEFEGALDVVNIVVKGLNVRVGVAEKLIATKKLNDKDGKKRLQEIRQQIHALEKPIKKYKSDENRECFEEQQQSLKDWAQFFEWFKGGKYHDIEGLCKIVNVDEVKGNDYSLNPGRYVGVTFVEDDGVDFKGRLIDLQEELNVLNKEASVLAKTISNNLKELI